MTAPDNSPESISESIHDGHPRLEHDGFTHPDTQPILTSPPSKTHKPRRVRKVILIGLVSFLIVVNALFTFWLIVPSSSPGMDEPVPLPEPVPTERMTADDGLDGYLYDLPDCGEGCGGDPGKSNWW